jgi:parvulin-like peptidyl-prolyl isomerase
MRTITPTFEVLLVVCAAVLAPGAVRGEMVEEIVAYVNGDIITSSELEEEEQVLLSEIYSRFAGEELDTQAKLLQEQVLLDMIDRKILYHRAARMYDVEKMSEYFYENFREQQQIDNDEEFAAILTQEGMTVEEFKQRLIETYAPQEVLQFEVGGRLSVGDRAVEEYYAEHPEEFTVVGEVTIREIVVLADTKKRKTELSQSAASIRDQAASAEDFGQIAKALSEAGTATNGGLLGPLKRGELSTRLEEVAFSLEVGAVSDVLEMPYGFHIIKIVERTEDTLTPLDEVREPLRQALENQAYVEKLTTFMKKARSEADWCVKKEYESYLPAQGPTEICKSL